MSQERKLTPIEQLAQFWEIVSNRSKHQEYPAYYHPMLLYLNENLIPFLNNIDGNKVRKEKIISQIKTLATSKILPENLNSFLMDLFENNAAELRSLIDENKNEEVDEKGDKKKIFDFQSVLDPTIQHVQHEQKIPISRSGLNFKEITSVLNEKIFTDQLKTEHKNDFDQYFDNIENLIMKLKTELDKPLSLLTYDDIKRELDSVQTGLSSYPDSYGVAEHAFLAVKFYLKQLKELKSENMPEFKLEETLLTFMQTMIYFSTNKRVSGSRQELLGHMGEMLFELQEIYANQGDIEKLKICFGYAFDSLRLTDTKKANDMINDTLKRVDTVFNKYRELLEESEKSGNKNKKEIIQNCQNLSDWQLFYYRMLFTYQPKQELQQCIQFISICFFNIHKTAISSIKFNLNSIPYLKFSSETLNKVFDLISFSGVKDDKKIITPSEQEDKNTFEIKRMLVNSDLLFLELFAMKNYLDNNKKFKLDYFFEFLNYTNEKFMTLFDQWIDKGRLNEAEQFLQNYREEIDLIHEKIVPGPPNENYFQEYINSIFAWLDSQKKKILDFKKSSVTSTTTTTAPHSVLFIPPEESEEQNDKKDVKPSGKRT